MTDRRHDIALGDRVLVGPKYGLTARSGESVHLDIDMLLRTRLLVQANSGGGKSWLLRRFAEQAFGKVPVILLDPEGEFASLREHFGYVLVGKGGETPADTRSAELVAHRLLELNASAVCDLYEMNPFDRHVWVQRFLGGLIEAPKKLWHPAVVIVEQHRRNWRRAWHYDRSDKWKPHRRVISCASCASKRQSDGRRRYRLHRSHGRGTSHARLNNDRVRQSQVWEEI